MADDSRLHPLEVGSPEQVLPGPSVSFGLSSEAEGDHADPPFSPADFNAPKVSDASSSYPVTLEDLQNQRCTLYPQAEKAKAWSAAAAKVRTYSVVMIEQWHKEIDTYLVYATLFSAILTAFNIESYRLLQRAGPGSAAADLDRRFGPVGGSSTTARHIIAPLLADGDSDPPIAGWAIWLNALWFSSLILSLASASIIIMVKQWLNQYTSGLSGTSREVSRLRQHRLNNLVKWRVAGIIIIIPILLQIALFLFLAGILVLLWNLQPVVATIASVLIGLLVAFTIITALLPLFNNSCAYLSPQTLLLYILWQPDWFTSLLRTLPLVIFRALAKRDWTVLRLVPRLRLKPTWRALERQTIIEGSKSGVLDIDILVAAYDKSLSPAVLADASVCLLDYDNHATIDFYQKLHSSLVGNYGSDGLALPLKPGSFAWKNTHGVLWINILLSLLTKKNSCTDKPLQQKHIDVLWECLKIGSFLPTMSAVEAGWALSTLCSLMKSTMGALEELRAAEMRPAHDYEVLEDAEALMARAEVLYDKICALLRWTPAHRGELIVHRRVPSHVVDQLSRLTATQCVNMSQTTTRGPLPLTTYLLSVRNTLGSSACAIHLSGPLGSGSIRSSVRVVLGDLASTLRRWVNLPADERNETTRVRAMVHTFGAVLEQILGIPDVAPLLPTDLVGLSLQAIGVLGQIRCNPVIPYYRVQIEELVVLAEDIRAVVESYVPPPRSPSPLGIASTRGGGISRPGRGGP